MTLFTISICCSRKKGFQALIYINYKSFDIHICSIQTGSFLHILHQSFEVERPKGHWSEVVVHLYIFANLVVAWLYYELFLINLYSFPAVRRCFCWQTLAEILIKYHTLLFSRVRKNVASRLLQSWWRFKG